MSPASSTKERILGIARDLFARQGYTGTSIADIARELGTTTAALYYHFPSKADILRALLADPMAAYTRLLDGMRDTPLPPEELLGALIDLAAESRELAVIIDRDPAVLKLITDQLPQPSEQLNEQVIAALAGPDADHLATIRAHAAYSVTKNVTLAAMSLGAPGADNKLDPADRAEILHAALRALDQ
jgi:AcrR family transcriptional regulator